MQSNQCWREWGPGIVGSLKGLDIFTWESTVGFIIEGQENWIDLKKTLVTKKILVSIFSHIKLLKTSLMF